MPCGMMLPKRSHPTALLVCFVTEMPTTRTMAALKTAAAVREPMVADSSMIAALEEGNVAYIGDDDMMYKLIAGVDGFGQLVLVTRKLQLPGRHQIATFGLLFSFLCSSLFLSFLEPHRGMTSAHGTRQTAGHSCE